MKVIINNSVIDLNLIWKIESKLINLTSMNTGCCVYRNKLVISSLNGGDHSVIQPNDLDDISWQIYVDTIVEFWAENKKEDIKTFNL